MNQGSLKAVKMLATGAYQPGEPVPYDEIERYLGELDEAPEPIQKMIRSFKPRMKEMLGMDYYYYAIDPETRETTESIVSLGTKAARRAIEKAGIEAGDIDLIVFGGALMERLICPPTAPMIQAELGIERCGEVSIHSNCTATYKAMQVAYDAIRLGRYETALIVSSTMPSQLFRKEYYNQKKVTLEQGILRWFLCDGAGAMILQADDDHHEGIYLMGTYIESVGTHYEPHMYTEFAASNINLLDNYEAGRHHLNQDLRKVAAVGGPIFLDGSMRMMKEFDLTTEEITYF
ncbi:MAG: 3-oxoacyl-ACP synthase, partial [Deltaproteobacteria bacterium]